MGIEFLHFGSVATQQLTQKWGGLRPFRGYAGRCLYCASPMRKAYFRVDELEEYPEEVWGFEGHECDACGWWWNREASDDWRATNPIINSGALHSVPLPDERVLCAVNQITDNISYLHDMNPSRFEDFIGNVFRDYCGCDVLHVGRSHDNGIDLVLLDSNVGQIPIQVKRRGKTRRSESVAVVREFRGALLLQGRDHGIIVTTADHFSRFAIRAGATDPSHSVQQRIELVDCRRLLEIMRVLGRTKILPDSVRIRFRYKPGANTVNSIVECLNERRRTCSTS